MHKRVFPISIILAIYCTLAACGADEPPAKNRAAAHDSVSIEGSSTMSLTQSQEEGFKQSCVDRALARTVIVALTNAVAGNDSRPQIEFFLTNRAVQSMADLTDAEFHERMRYNILHNGMIPNVSNLGGVVDLSRNETYQSHISGVAYYDRDISPGVNHEPVRIDLRYEDSRWLIDSWRQG